MASHLDTQGFGKVQYLDKKPIPGTLWKIPGVFFAFLQVFGEIFTYEVTHHMKNGWVTIMIGYQEREIKKNILEKIINIIKFWILNGENVMTFNFIP